MLDPADPDDPAAEIVDGVPEGEPTGATDAAPGAAAATAAADDDDDDIVDAEVVPTPNISFAPPVVTPRFDYTDAGVPTLDYLRDKIEGRYGTALGGTELAQESQEGRDQADREAARAKAAADKLAEIRRSLHPEG